MNSRAECLRIDFRTKEKVCVKGMYSYWKVVACGVSQESVLGPLLFRNGTNSVGFGISYYLGLQLLPDWGWECVGGEKKVVR